MTVYWLIQQYSNRPDGGTVQMFIHHKRLRRRGIKSVFVSNRLVTNRCKWLDIGQVIDRYRMIKQVTDDDFIITSWDQPLSMIQKFKKGKKIAYLQSHFANHPSSYVTSLPLVTVSDFAKNYIQQKYGRPCQVLYNVVDVQGLRPLRWQKKVDQIVTAQCRRDRDVLQRFSQRTSKPLKQIRFTDRKSFLNHVNNSRFYLSYYREDAFGLPPVQAMKLGTVPIIVTNTTGKDYAKDGYNCIIRSPSQKWKDSEIRQYDLQKIIRNGFKTARKYSKSDIVKFLSEFK